jgi:hypothetical protein
VRYIPQYALSKPSHTHRPDHSIVSWTDIERREVATTYSRQRGMRWTRSMSCAPEEHFGGKTTTISAMRKTHKSSYPLFVAFDRDSISTAATTPANRAGRTTATSEGLEGVITY